MKILRYPRSKNPRVVENKKRYVAKAKKLLNERIEFYLRLIEGRVPIWELYRLGILAQLPVDVRSTPLTEKIVDTINRSWTASAFDAVNDTVQGAYRTGHITKQERRELYELLRDTKAIREGYKLIGEYKGVEVYILEAYDKRNKG